MRAGVQWLHGTLAVRPHLVDLHWRPIPPLPDWPAIGYALVEGLIRVWFRQRWPALHKQYIVANTETPVRWRLAPDEPWTLEVQPDVLLISPDTRAYLPLDFKFSTRLDDDWRHSWAAQPQTVAYRAAIEQPVRVPWRTGPVETGVLAAGMIIEGIDRGEIRHGLFTSPLVSGYAMARTVSSVSQMSPTRLNNAQRRVHIPPSEASVWQRFAALPQMESVTLPRASEGAVAQYRDLALRHLRTVALRQEQAAAVHQWPMTGLVTGECCSPQRRCAYAHLCFPGVFEPVALQPRDPHHNPYLGDDE